MVLHLLIYLRCSFNAVNSLNVTGPLKLNGTAHTHTHTQTNALKLVVYPTVCFWKPHLLAEILHMAL